MPTTSKQEKPRRSQIEIRQLLWMKTFRYLPASVISQARLSLDLFPISTHTIRIGIEAVSQKFNPGEIESLGEADKTILSIPTATLSAFVEDEAQLFSRANIQIGIRGSAFKSGDSTIMALEPRLLLSVRLAKEWDIQAAYSRMRQNIHLLSNNGVGLPNDIWVPATPQTGIAVADQYSLGLAGSVKAVPLSFTLETYYKKLYRLDRLPYRSLFYFGLSTKLGGTDRNSGSREYLRD